MRVDTSGYIGIEITFGLVEDLFIGMLCKTWGGIKGPDGSASMKWYRESNCQRLSFKDLNFTTYVQTMAKGKQNYTVPFEDSEVQYPEPEGAWYALLSSVCDYVNSN